MKITNFFGLLLKGLSLIAVVGILALATGVFLYSFLEIYKVLYTLAFQSASNEELILQALKAIDLVLLGVVFFVMGVSLFELFVGAIDNLPEWLVIKNIDELKSMLVKVVIVVLGVSFCGKIITWDGETDLMGFGIALGVVIAALSFFLRVKADKEK